MKRLLLAAALLPLAACTSPLLDTVCPDWIPPAVQVTVQDSLSGAVITPGATVVIRDGAYADSLTVPPPVETIGLGSGRVGTYEVTVRKSGYRNWVKAGVQAKDGTCGVQTVNLVARLVPSS
ncbi:MAG TPA: hypothetical protein VF092_19295 [Longimicrobium sp.]